MSSAAYAAFKLAMSISPIILTRGIAASVGNALPIVAITEGANFVDTLLASGSAPKLDDFFAQYQPLVGGTLLQNQVGTYPFANQAVAANAIVAQPLTISMRMIVPAKGDAGYLVKLATMTALKKTLDQHNFLGGTYSGITPGYIYTDCLLGLLQDMSGGESKQDQYEWRWDFLKPLVSSQDADAAHNALMQKLKSGLPLTGSVPLSFGGLLVGNAASSLLSSVTSLAVPQ